MLRFVHPFSLTVVLRSPKRASSALLRVHTPCSYPPSMVKRKRSAAAAPSPVAESSLADLPPSRRSKVQPSAKTVKGEPKPPRHQPSRGGNSATTNPDANPDILDSISAIRASPDGGESEGPIPALKPRKDAVSIAETISRNAGSGAEESATTEVTAADQGLYGRREQPSGTTIGGGAESVPNATKADMPACGTTAADRPLQPGRNKRKKGPSQHVKVDSAESNSAAVNAAVQHVTPSSRIATKVEEDVGVTVDPEIEEGPRDENEDGQEAREDVSRPPPVNSDVLPLPWKGRLGYVGDLCCMFVERELINFVA